MIIKMPTEILEMNETTQNDNIVESITEIKSNENVCVLDNHWRELVKAHEKRLTEKDEVINILEKQLEAHQAINEKEVQLDLSLLDKFTLLRHKIQDLENIKQELTTKMVQVNDLVDHLEDHFI